MLLTSEEYTNRLKNFGIELGSFCSSARPNQSDIENLKELFDVEYKEIECDIPKGYKLDNYKVILPNGEVLKKSKSVDHITICNDKLYFIECKEISESFSNSFLRYSNKDGKDRFKHISPKDVSLMANRIYNSSKTISILLDEKNDVLKEMNSFGEITDEYRGTLRILDKDIKSSVKDNYLKFDRINDCMQECLKKVESNIGTTLKSSENLNIVPYIFFDYKVAEDRWGELYIKLLYSWVFNTIRHCGGKTHIGINKRELGVIFGRDNLNKITTGEVDFTDEDIVGSTSSNELMKGISSMYGKKPRERRLKFHRLGKVCEVKPCADNNNYSETYIRLPEEK